MDDSKISTERFITLSREYVDDVMGDRKIKIKKEHYYIFAISNFIATKEHFLKKKIDYGKTKIKFNEVDNLNILPMILEFYNGIKSKNKNFKEPSTQEINKKIEFIPCKIYDDEELMEINSALYLFNEIRNSLSHPGNYEIKEKNGEYIVLIKNINSNKIGIPIELFDFIAFYINSYFEGTNIDDIFQNYLIYKESKDNKKYYSFESKHAIDKIVNLLSKTKIRINQKKLTLTRNRSGSNSRNSYDEELDEFINNYGESANTILDKIKKANISNEQKMEFLVQLNIIARADKRISNIKIDKCIENIESILKLDRKSASLYSHSIILFTNREEQPNTNAQTVLNNIDKIRKSILSISIVKLEELDNASRKRIIEEYKQIMEKILEELPNLIRIDEHKYRNAIFHNNVRFNGKEIHFWNQKDNTNPNDIHTFNIYKTSKMYNLELKNIETYNMNVGEITIGELFNILGQYCGNDDNINEMIGKLWNINELDNELLNWDMSINNFLNNINAKIKELSPESR